jgi:hypothetical protein
MDPGGLVRRDRKGRAEIGNIKIDPWVACSRRWDAITMYSVTRLEQFESWLARGKPASNVLAGFSMELACS